MADHTPPALLRLLCLRSLLSCPPPPAAAPPVNQSEISRDCVNQSEESILTCPPLSQWSRKLMVHESMSLSITGHRKPTRAGLAAVNQSEISKMLWQPIRDEYLPIRYDCTTPRGSRDRPCLSSRPELHPSNIGTALTRSFWTSSWDMYWKPIKD